jgi:hypothetical protein
MPGPIFHTISSYAFLALTSSSQRQRKVEEKSIYSTFFYIFLFGNLPDIDLLWGLLNGDMFRYHRLYTHSLVCLLVIQLICEVLVLDLPLARTRVRRGFFLCYFHLLVDLFSGPAIGWQAGYGLSLFAPLVDLSVQLPLSIFPPYKRDLFCWQNVLIAGWEFLLAMCFFSTGFVKWLKRHLM